MYFYFVNSRFAVDTLGKLLALYVISAAEDVREVTQKSGEVAFVDQSYAGAKTTGIELMVVKLVAAKKDFVLLPRRWVVERSFVWTARFRRLAHGFELLLKSCAACI